MMAPGILSRNIQNVYLSLIVQVAVRLTIVLSAGWAARRVQTEQLGLMNVRLLLFEQLVLMLCREAIRKASLKNVSNNDWPRVMNLVWTAVPLSAVTCLLLGWAWYSLLDPPSPHLCKAYYLGILSMSFSCVIEVAVEPVNLLARAFYFNLFRNVGTLVYMVVRTSVFMILVSRNPDQALVAFSASQIASILAWALTYYTFFAFYLSRADSELKEHFTSIRDVLPTPKLGLPGPVVRLARNLTWTSITRHLLAEGDRYVMTLTHVLSFVEQGVFDAVGSLGSLPVRLGLRPLEDPFYLYFAHTFASRSRAAELSENERNEVCLVIAHTLRLVVLVSSLLGVGVVCHGQELLRAYGGDLLDTHTALRMLEVHAVIFLLLATITLVENFAYATMTVEQVGWYNWFLAVTAGIYLALGWWFTAMRGSLGLLESLCVVLALRLVFCLTHMHTVFKGTNKTPLYGLLPHPRVMTTVLVALAASLLSEDLTHCGLWYYTPTTHLAFGGVTLAVALLTHFVVDRDLRRVLSGNGSGHSS